jgi:predicted protein tyrosine phosphatase
VSVRKHLSGLPQHLNPVLVSQHPWIKPNRRVVAFADEILRRDGRMHAAVGVIWAKLMGRSGFRVPGA